MTQPIRIFGLLLALVPIPVTISLALITGNDAVALLGVVSGCLAAHLILKKQKRTWAGLGLTIQNRWIKTVIISCVAAVGMLFTTSVSGSLLNYLGGLTPDISKFDVLRGNVAALIVGLAVVWTIAAFGEEMLFRGFVLNEIKDLIGTWITGEKSALICALLVTSVLFGLAHAYQGLAGIILTGIAGLGFGIVYLVTRRNLMAAILTHGIYDTIAFFLVFTNYDELIV